MPSPLLDIFRSRRPHARFEAVSAAHHQHREVGEREVMLEFEALADLSAWLAAEGFRSPKGSTPTSEAARTHDLKPCQQLLIRLHLAFGFFT
jgi:hypothetical protein